MTELESLRAWCDICKAFQEEEFLKDFLVNVGLYEGRPSTPAYSPSRPFKTHTVFPIVDSNVSVLYARNPMPRVHSRRENFLMETSQGTRLVDGVKTAKLIEDVVGYVVREQELKRQFREVVRDAELGYGAVEVGWNSKIDLGTVSGEVYEDEKKREVSLEYQEHLRSEASYTVRRDPRQFLFPPFAPDFYNLPFLFFWEDVSADEVITQENFLPDARKEIKQGIGKGGALRFVSGNRSSELMYGAIDMRKINRRSDFGLIRLYHYWSLKEKKYKVFSECCDKFLRNDDWPFEKMEGYPFEFLSFFPSYRSLYPIAPAEIYKTKAIEKERLRVRMLDAVDKAVTKVLTTSQDRREREAFASSGHGELVTVKQMEAYKELIVSHMPPEWIVFYQMIENDVLVEAQTLETKIGTGATAEKATELIQREQSFQVKRLKKADAVASFIGRVYKKIWQLWAENMTEEQSIRISSEGGFSFRQFSKSDIQGEYDFEINVDDAAPPADAKKVSNARAMLEISVNDPHIDRRELWVQLLDGMKLDREKILSRAEDIDVLKLAEMEWQQILAGQVVDVLPGERHSIHITAHLRKVLEFQQAQNQGRAFSEQEIMAVGVLIEHIQKHEEFIAPQGSVLPPGKASKREGGTSPESSRSPVRTPIGEALSQTTTAARETQEQTP